jgi:predicted nucleic-acid-binding Zn-ribbon protein
MSEPIDYESLVKPKGGDDLTAPINCPKCGSAMEMGTVGTEGGFGTTMTPPWFFYVGRFEPGLIGYKFTSYGEYPIVPCRCTHCGFVELYAPKK